MSPEYFKSLLELIDLVIAKQTTCIHELITAEIWFAVTQRYLASGETEQSPAWSYQLGKIIVSTIIRKTC